MRAQLSTRNSPEHVDHRVMRTTLRQCDRRALGVSASRPPSTVVDQPPPRCKGPSRQRGAPPRQTPESQPAHRQLPAQRPSVTAEQPSLYLTRAHDMDRVFSRSALARLSCGTSARGRHRHRRCQCPACGSTGRRTRRVRLPRNAHPGCSRQPWREESVSWPVWATPVEVARWAVAAFLLSSVAFGHLSWALRPYHLAGYGAARASLVFGWLGGRSERDLPEACTTSQPLIEAFCSPSAHGCAPAFRVTSSDGGVTGMSSDDDAHPIG